MLLFYNHKYAYIAFFFVAQCKQLNCNNTGKQRKTNIKLKHELKILEKKNKKKQRDTTDRN